MASTYLVEVIELDDNQITVIDSGETDTLEKAISEADQAIADNPDCAAAIFELKKVVRGRKLPKRLTSILDRKYYKTEG